MLVYVVYCLNLQELQANVMKNMVITNWWNHENQIQNTAGITLDNTGSD